MVDIETPEHEVPFADVADDPTDGADDEPALEEIDEDGGTPEDDVPSLIVGTDEADAAADGV